MATENLSVAAAFDLSYQDLAGAGRRLFRRLGLHPGPDIDPHAAAALDDTSPHQARRQLEDLYDQHLITQPAPGRYHLRQMVADRGLSWAVFNDYPMLPGSRRSLSADLVIRGTDSEVLVAAEFKYEPSHDRVEFRALPGKLPVVFWGIEGAAKDVVRIREFVEAGKAQTAYAVFIDEGRYFRNRPAHLGTQWRDWEPARPGSLSPSVLWARWPTSTEH